MDKFRVIVSSVYPSDLMAVLFARSFEENLLIELEINESFDLGNSAHRNFVSRAALPRLEWSFCDDGIWRQKFLPIDSLDDSKLEWAIIDTVENYHEIFSVDEDARTEFRTVIGRVIREFRALPHQTTKRKWASMTSILLTHIFAFYGIKTIERSGFSKTRNDGLSEHDLRSLCTHIAEEMTRKSMVEGRFSFGGQVVLRELATGAERRLDSAKLSEGRLVLFGECGEFDSRHLEEEITQGKLAILVKGPLQMVLSKPAIHLPWYAKGSFVELSVEDADGVEFLSPMVVYDEQRSFTSSDSPKRLVPTGYSLIEYSTPQVIAACSFLLGSDIGLDDLADWREMVSTFPASREKLSKRQGRLIVPLIANLRKRARHTLDATGQMNELVVLESNNVSLPTTTLGKRLILTAELLKFLCDCSNIYSPRDFGGFDSDRVTELGFTDNEGFVQVGEISDHIEVLVEQIVCSLKNWGISDSALESRFSSGISELRGCSSFMVCVREKTELPKHFRKAVKNTDLYVQHLLEEYYKFASFFCASVLKAHPLLFCATHSEQEGRKALQELIRRRHGAPFHAFRLEVLDAISA